MKIVFFGTSDFAILPLKAIFDKYEVVAIVCQPDKARDRKGNFIFSPVKKFALENNISLYQFNKLRVDGVDVLKNLHADMFVTAAYGQILSQEILDIPPFGTLNVHGSLLPKYRGSAPMQWCLINGEEYTGVTIMKTDIGVDTGDILTSKTVKITDDMTLSSLSDTLSQEGAKLLISTIDDIENITPIKQDESASSVCRMLTKQDAIIDFNKTNREIFNLIRGIGYATTTLNGETLKLYSVSLSDEQGKAGEVLYCDKQHGIVVACGSGAIKLNILQKSNKNKMSDKDFMNGVKIPQGTILG